MEVTQDPILKWSQAGLNSDFFFYSTKTRKASMTTGCWFCGEKSWNQIFPRDIILKWNTNSFVQIFWNLIIIKCLIVIIIIFSMFYGILSFFLNYSFLFVYFQYFEQLYDIMSSKYKQFEHRISVLSSAI